jgi:hypothetical protein
MDLLICGISLILPYSKFPESSRRICEFDAHAARSIPFRHDSETNETIETVLRCGRDTGAGPHAHGGGENAATVDRGRR